MEALIVSSVKYSTIFNIVPNRSIDRQVEQYELASRWTSEKWEVQVESAVWPWPLGEESALDRDKSECDSRWGVI